MINFLYNLIFLLFVIGCNSQEKKENSLKTQINKEQKIENSDSIIVYKLLSSYPDFIDSISNNYVYFKDNTVIEFNNNKQKKSFDDTLNYASIKDQFCQNYSVGKNYNVPISLNFDPGRIRNDEFFKKMYGGTKNEVSRNLVTIIWLPKKLGIKIKFSKINGASKQLQKVSNELDLLPDSLFKYLNKLGGTFNWRPIAGTNRQSMHSFGVSIDINTEYSHYWRNTKPNSKGLYDYKNKIPFEIVKIFEKYGFIWGGKWYHYDTMHFEYRPELIN